MSSNPSKKDLARCFLENNKSEHLSETLQLSYAREFIESFTKYKGKFLTRWLIDLNSRQLRTLYERKNKGAL
ncbi:MAG: hypothetical protein LBC87_07405 [Fibromonadaceae bacterium]|jgi:hypothetical protein|nr:hypothetical protein [Fibromonadaceae bacterium]